MPETVPLRELTTDALAKTGAAPALLQLILAVIVTAHFIAAWPSRRGSSPSTACSACSSLAVLGHRRLFRRLCGR